MTRDTDTPILSRQRHQRHRQRHRLEHQVCVHVSLCVPLAVVCWRGERRAGEGEGPEGEGENARDHLAVPRRPWACPSECRRESDADRGQESHELKAESVGGGR